jgi:hypothetical protein
MTSRQVRLDESLAENLRAVNDEVDIIDERGLVRGIYIPVRKYVPPPGYKPPFSDEELARLSKVRTGRPLADIIHDLEAKHGKP